MAKMNGSQYLAETLDAYGVSHVFFVPAVLMEALAKMEKTGVRRIMAHAEKSAAYMADGYARVSGRPGVCMAQNIGGSNLAAGLRDARMAGSPVIAISGGPSPAGRFRGYYQEIEDFPQFDAVTKFNAVVEDPTRLPDLLRQCFREATTGTPGPVHLQFQGVTGEVIECTAEMEAGIQPAFRAAPAFRPQPPAGQVEAALKRLRAAKRPVIVAGGGVAWSGAQAQVVELAERLDIPVATSLNAKGTILDTHRLSLGVVGVYSRDCANKAVAEADLVVFIGSRTGSQVTNNWRTPARSTPVVHIDIEPREIGRNYLDTVPVHGDARAVIERMLEALPATPKRPGAWSRRTASLVAEWRERETPLLSSDARPIRPERLCSAISSVLPEGGIVVSDTGHSGMWSSTMIDFTRPGQRYIRCAGSLGWSLPAAMGIKCAAPDRAVVCFNGDGAIYYHIGELETAARHDIPVVVVVNNNAAFNQEVHLVEAGYGGRMTKKAAELWELRDVDFASVAESFGCAGLRVTDPADLEPTIREAIALGRPVVVDVKTDVEAMARHAWAPPS